MQTQNDKKGAQPNSGKAKVDLPPLGSDNRELAMKWLDLVRENAPETRNFEEMISAAEGAYEHFGGVLPKPQDAGDWFSAQKPSERPRG